MARAARWFAATLLAGCGTEITVRTDPPDPVGPDDGTHEDLEPPKAICQAQPGAAPPLTAIDWVGETSYDPDQSALINYRWTLAQQPAGSAADLPDGQANLRGFVPDVVGRYVATLVVTDATGKISEACAADLDVVPDHALWIEAWWQIPHDDFDLHLVRGDARSPAARDDCYVGACDQDWGTPGDTTDDPEVLQDDVEGRGPESIGVLAPDDDSYTIWVVDRPLPFLTADNAVTVRVSVRGGAMREITKVIADDGRREPFARVDWPSGDITEL
ncbi:MAG TPA: hypothetical protein PKA64_19515 [Myxococcota bacterium]|nr:hypothetical protein [Myxococcota bacterium]